MICTKRNDKWITLAFKLNTYPAAMRCLWEISIRSPLREIFQRPFRNISKDVFFVTSLRYLKYMSNRSLFSDVIKTSQKHLKKDVFCVTSLRRPKNIFCKYVSFFKNTSQKWFRVIYVGLLQYLIKQMWDRQKHSRNESFCGSRA